MVDKLMNPGIIRANMGFRQLPHPITGGVHRRRDNALWPQRAWFEAELYSYGLEGSSICQEENSPRCICFAAIKGIDFVDEWQVYVVVINDKELARIQSLSKPLH